MFARRLRQAGQLGLQSRTFGYTDSSIPFSGWSDDRCADEILKKSGEKRESHRPSSDVAEDCHTLFLRLSGGGGEIGEKSFEAVLRILAKQTRFGMDRFWDVFNMLLKTDRFHPTALHFDIALRYWVSISHDRYYNSEGIFCVRVVLQEMSELGFALTPELAKSVLSATSKSQDEGLAFWLVDSGFVQLETSLDYERFACSCLTKHGMQRVLREMKEKDIPFTPNGLYHIAKLAGNLGEPLSFIEGLILQNEPALRSREVVGGLVRLYLARDLPARVIQLVRKLPRALQSSEVVACYIESCTALYVATGEARHVSQAERFHQQVLRQRQHRAAQTHLAILALWNITGDASKAQELRDYLERHDCTLTGRQKRLFDAMSRQLSGTSTGSVRSTFTLSRGNAPGYF
ncbi:hypothetical protein DIPPA_03912 [Diplonema papillatum]|nr:hypothetical protein DIPPA_03912 [Diplonema papillatum]